MNLWAQPLRVFSLVLLGLIVGCVASRQPVRPPLPPEPPMVLPLPTARAAPLPPKPPLTRAIFACDVEYSPMVGLYGVFEVRTNMNVGRWHQVDAFPYDGGTHYWTNAFANSQQCFVRVGRVWPK